MCDWIITPPVLYVMASQTSQKCIELDTIVVELNKKKVAYPFKNIGGYRRVRKLYKISTSFHLETILIRYQIKYKALVTLLVYILRILQVDLCIYLQLYYRLRGSVSVVLQLVYKSSLKLLLVSNQVLSACQGLRWYIFWCIR